MVTAGNDGLHLDAETRLLFLDMDMVRDGSQRRPASDDGNQASRQPPAAFG